MRLSPAQQHRPPPPYPKADPSPARMGEEISAEGHGLLALSAGLLDAVLARFMGSIPSALQILMIKHIPLFYFISSKFATLQEL